MYGRNLKAYQRTNLEAELSVASPHRVVQMMFEGLLERLAQAKGAIERKDYEYKSDRLSKAVGIINGLQMSLDPSYNKELGERLSSLYEYMKERLNEAAVKMDPDPINEVISLVNPIKKAWDQIPQEDKDQMNQILENKRSQEDGGA